MNFWPLRVLTIASIVGILAACTTTVHLDPVDSSPNARPIRAPIPGVVRSPNAPVSGTPDLTGMIEQPKSRWLPVDWADLPGFNEDALHEAWNAWVKSCERPSAIFATICQEARPLSIASGQEQRAWMMARLQPYRVESLQGESQGLLTAYYEPFLDASRTPTSEYAVPLYRLPAGYALKKPWYTRQQIDTLPAAQAALQGRAIAWVRDPVEAMALHIQGSGRLRIAEANGTTTVLRVAYAGTNDQPYQSIGRWLLDQGLVRDATWPGIRGWAARNPQRLNELLWSNPRYVFFKEEPLNALDASFGPKGAQGVPLTPGRSIAVDRQSIPYGTPVWMASSGLYPLQRLVLAQDTGSAIVGAVRADFFTGWGDEAGDIAGRLKQDLRLWALWPR